MSEQTLQNSPPQAYESVYSQETIDHGTVYLDDPYSYETPEEAHRRALQTIQDIAGGKRSDFVKQTLDTEAKLLGVSPTAEGGEKFLSAHLNLMHEVSDHFKARFDKYIDTLPGMVAADTATTDTEAHQLEVIMRERLVHQWFSVTDVYRSEFAEQSGAKGALGATNRASKEITLNSNAVIEFLANKNSAAYVEEKFEIIAQHELLHGVFGTWFDADGVFNKLVSTGLSVSSPEEQHGGWLDEATIEKYRHRKFKTETFTYEAEVLALGIADALKPDFEKQRLRAAVTNEGRGQVIGTLEEVFGPLAPEVIEELINSVKGIDDLPRYRHALLGLVGEADQERAAAAYDAVAEPLMARVKAGNN